MTGGARLLVAHPTANEHEIGGYVLVHLAEYGFLLNDLAVTPGHAAVSALLTSIAAAYPTDQQVGGRVFLPIEPTIDQTLQALFVKIEQEALDTVMMRPLDTALDGAMLSELSMAPGVIFWPMDQL